MGDLGVIVGIPVLHINSVSAIQLAQNPIFHANTKHIEVKYHFIKKLLEDKRLELVKVHMDDNLVDLMMKGLPSKRFACLREMMGIGG